MRLASVDANQRVGVLLQAEREAGVHGDLALEDHLELCWLELGV